MDTKTKKILIIFTLFMIIYSNVACIDNQIIDKSNGNTIEGANPNACTIVTEFEQFSIMDEINASFTFFRLSGYFRFALSSSSDLNNFSAIIYQSLDIPGGDGTQITMNHLFNPKNYDLNMKNFTETYYLCLIYYNFYSICICANKAIQIYKEPAICYSSNNNTIYSYGESIDFQLNFCAMNNFSRKIENTRINWQIFQNNLPISEIYKNFTNNFGDLSINLTENICITTGSYKLRVFINCSDFFKDFFCNINFEINKIGVFFQINPNTAESYYVSNLKTEFIECPIWINTYHNQSLYHDLDYNPNIIFNEISYTMIDLNNGTYLFNLVTQNIASKINITIFYRNCPFIFENISFFLNISKRPVDIVTHLPEPLLINHNSELILSFDIIDVIEESKIYLIDIVELKYYKESRWVKFNQTPGITGNNIFFNITYDLLEELDLLNEEMVLMKISLIENVLYLNYELNPFAISIENTSNTNEPNDSTKNNFSLIKKTISSIGIGLSIALGIKFLIKRTKKTYKLANIKV